MDAALNALAILEKERQTLDQHWQLRLEHARYEVQRAQRQYDAVEPENRLVARELERRWNDALTALRELEQAYDRVQRTELAPLSDTEQAEVRQLAQNLPQLWHAATTQPVDRKRLLRIVITEVTLTTEPSTRRARCVVLWSGGMTTAHEIRRVPIGEALKTAPESPG